MRFVCTRSTKYNIIFVYNRIQFNKFFFFFGAMKYDKHRKNPPVGVYRNIIRTVLLYFIDNI